MPTFVEIAVNVPQVSGVFDYHIPAELEGHLAAGQLVTVPFGQQIVQGIVLKLKDQPSVSQTKPVGELLDPKPVLTLAQLELAQYLAEHTLAPLSACIDIMLPPGLYKQAEYIYTAVDGKDAAATGLKENQKQLLKLLQRRGPLSAGQIDHALRHSNWRITAHQLIRQGFLISDSILTPPTVKPKLIRTVQLAVSPETAVRAMPDLARTDSNALRRRQAVLTTLIGSGSPLDVTWIYAETGANLSDLKVLIERGLILTTESEGWRDPIENLPVFPDNPPTLTTDQQAAWQQIYQIIDESGAGQNTDPILLHGVTGSGKTELYLQAVERTISKRRQAIILVPEIALTPQTIQRFAGRFPGQVGLYHSKLSQGERYDTWRRARIGSIAIAVGPRSALFLPFPKVGLIVVDECHDDSYYQAEQMPHYHTRQAAIRYAHQSGAVCLLGSATPDVTTVYQASKKRLHYFHLPNRILAHKAVIEALVERANLAQSQYQPLEGEAQFIPLPPVKIVDMREELHAGNRSIFSRDLRDEIAQVLDQGQQAILFLNRRGSATYVFCRNCGYTLKCPRCELPLTLHLGSTTSGLQCHHCGYHRNNPEICPSCHARQIRHYGTGTEKVEFEVQQLFPQARTIRWDYETTRLKGAHELILRHFASRQADILIGTQMLAKGLDLPMVTLVGVVLADVGLNLPDYRAAERTFQNLTQVSGRAGRSPLGGRVILQTFQPDHYVIQAAARHQYKQFYQRELEYRRQLGYPPFTQLIRLEYRHHNLTQAEQATQNMAARLQDQIKQLNQGGVSLIGPAPCFFSKLRGYYRWQIVLKGTEPMAVIKDMQLGEFKIEVNPPNLL